MKLARHIERELRGLGRPERATGEKKYLKSELRHLGVSMPELRQVVKVVAREHADDVDRDSLVALAERLWTKPIHELRMAAVELLMLRKVLLKPADMKLVERLLRESKTWALVDPLAIAVAGDLVERYASLGKTLDRWSCDDDFWIRRSAMLALLKPLRRGEGDLDRFLRYADAMLDEKEFFIRKAIGWILRETGKKRPAEVHDWVATRTHRASGVTMREAVKPLSAKRRDRLMRAYREKRPSA